MDNITDISERFFEPCHIDEAVSPFLFREKRFGTLLLTIINEFLIFYNRFKVTS